MKSSHPFLILFLILTHTLSNCYADDSNYKKKLETFISDLNPEKVYVQTDRQYYYSGDMLNFKAYVLSASSFQPVIVERMLYIELYNELDKLERKMIFPIDSGFSKGQLMLNEEYPAGEYTLVAYTNWMKNNGDEALFRKKFSLYHPIETKNEIKIDYKITSDKKGDSVYVTLQNNHPEGQDDLGAVLSIPLKDDELVAHVDLENNSKLARFYIPKNERPEDFVLNAEFTKGAASYTRQIDLIKNSEPKLYIMPEGGNLIAGIENKVAFKLLDYLGEPLDIHGAVQDESGHTICSCDPKLDGMGVFLITPKTDQAYFFVVQGKNGESHSYPLPESINDGIGIMLSNKLSNDFIEIKFNSTNKKKQHLTLLAYVAEEVFLEKSFEFEGSKSLKLDRASFPSGASRLVVFNQKGDPLAERMVFMMPDKNVNISIKEGNNTYEKRKKVNFKLKINNQDQPVSWSKLAISFSDLNSAGNISYGENICTYLLLNSEIKGNIRKPSWFFENYSEEKAQLLDLVMLTHGWSRYDLKAIEKAAKNDFVYERDSLFYIRGNIRSPLLKRPLSNYIVQTRLRFGALEKRAPMLTDENGNFHFNLTDFEHPYDFHLEIANKKRDFKDAYLTFETPYIKRELDLLRMTPEISVDQKLVGVRPWTQEAGIPTQGPGSFSINEVYYYNDAYRDASFRKDNYFKVGGDTVMLTEFEKEAEKLTNIRAYMANKYGTPDIVVEASAIRKLAQQNPHYISIWDLLENEIPDLKIDFEEESYNAKRKEGYYIYDSDGEAGDRSFIVLRDVKQVFIDGRPAIVQGGGTEFGDYQTVSNRSELYYMDPKNIEAVEVILQPKMVDIKDLDIPAMSDFDMVNYNMSNNKILLITTKGQQGFSAAAGKGRYMSKINGFTKYKAFYSPDYSNSQVNTDTKNDQRKTLFWNPDITLKDAEEKTFDFYLSDKPGGILATVEGITSAGKPFYHQEVFNKTQKAESNTIKDSSIVIPETAKHFRNDNTLDEYNDVFTFLVVDENTSKPISFSIVMSDSKASNYISNDEGELSINMENIPDEISFHYPGYEPLHIRKNELTTDSVLISLKKAALLPVSYSEKKTKDLMSDLIKHLSDHVNRETVKFGFYREKVYQNGWLWALNEHTLWFSSRSASRDLIEDRTNFVKQRSFKTFDYREKMRYEINKNEINYPYDADAINVKKEFLLSNYQNKFLYHVVGKQKVYGSLCTVVDFDMKNGVILPLQKGRMWINEKENEILHIKYEISPRGKPYVSYPQLVAASKNETLQPVDMKYEASYFQQGKFFQVKAIRENLSFTGSYGGSYTFKKCLVVNKVIPSKGRMLQSKNLDKLERRTFLVNKPKYSSDYWTNITTIKAEKDIMDQIGFLHEVTLRY